MVVEVTAVAAVLAGSLTPTGRRWLRAAGDRVAELRSLARDAFARPYHQLRVEEDTSAPLATYAATCFAGEAEPKRCCTVLLGEVLLIGPAIDRLEPMLPLGGAEVTMEDSRVSITGWQPPPKVELEFDSAEEAETWVAGLRQAASNYRAPPGRLLSLVEHLVAQEMHNSDLASLACKTKGRCEKLELKLRNVVAQDKEAEEVLKAKLEKAEQAVKRLRKRGTPATDEAPELAPAMPGQGGGKRSEIIGVHLQGLLKDATEEEVVGIREQLSSLTSQLSEVASMRRTPDGGVVQMPEGDNLDEGAQQAFIAGPFTSLPSVAEGPPLQELLVAVEGQLREATQRISALKEWNEQLTAEIWRYEHQVQADTGSAAPHGGPGPGAGGSAEQARLLAQVEGLVDEKAEQLRQLREAHCRLAEDSERQRQLHLLELQEVKDKHDADIELVQQAAAAQVQQALEQERRSQERELEALREQALLGTRPGAPGAAVVLNEERESFRESCLGYERRLEEVGRAHDGHAAELACLLLQRDQELRELRQAHAADLERASQREEALQLAHRDRLAAALQESEEELVLAQRGMAAELDAALRQQEDALLVRQGRIAELEAAARQRDEAQLGNAGRMAELEAGSEALARRVLDLEAACREKDEELRRLRSEAPMKAEPGGAEAPGQLAQLRQLCTVREERIRKLEEEQREKEGQILQMQGEVVRKSQELERMALKISSPRTRMLPSPENDPKNIVYLTFEPGSLGLSFEVEGGLVVEVDEHGQANQNGVQSGWVIHLVDDAPYAGELFEQRMSGCLPYVLAFKTKARVPAVEKATLVRQMQKQRMELQILRQLQIDPEGELTGQELHDRALRAEAQLEQLLSTSREERGAMQEALARLESQHASAQQRAEEAEREAQAAAAREAAQRQDRDAGLRKLAEVEARLAKMEAEAFHSRMKLEASHELGGGATHQTTEGLHLAPERHYALGSGRAHAAAAAAAAAAAGHLQPSPQAEAPPPQALASPPGSLGNRPPASASPPSSPAAYTPSGAAPAADGTPLAAGPRILRGYSQQQQQQQQVVALGAGAAAGAAVLSDGATSGTPVTEAPSSPADMPMMVAPARVVAPQQQRPVPWPATALLPPQAVGGADPAGCAGAAPSPASGSDVSTPQAFSSMMQRPLSSSRITTLPPQMATATWRLSPVNPPQGMWSPPEPRLAPEAAPEAAKVPMQSSAKASMSSQPAQAVVREQASSWSTMPAPSPRGPAIQPGPSPSASQRALQGTIRCIQPGAAQRPPERLAQPVQTVVQTVDRHAFLPPGRSDGLTNSIQLPRRGSWGYGPIPERSSFGGVAQALSSSMPPRSNTDGAVVS